MNNENPFAADISLSKFHYQRMFHEAVGGQRHALCD